jgi:hypothetical protein
MRINNMTRRDKDTLRVDLTGNVLMSIAVMWYTDNVESWNCPVKDWKFESLVCALYK